MNDFLIVNMVLTGEKRAIRKSLITGFYEDEIKNNKSGEMEECVKIEFKDEEWIRVKNSFDYIALEMKKGGTN